KRITATLLMAFVLAALGHSTESIAADKPGVVITNWTKTTPLPGVRYNHGVALVGRHVFAVGGNAGNAVLSAEIVEPGRLGAWKPSAALPVHSMNYPRVTVVGRRLYVLAGDTGMKEEGLPVLQVFYGDVADDGSIAAWREGPRLPKGSSAIGCAVVVNNALYYMGGWYGRRVQRAAVLPDGDLGPWTSLGNLPGNMMGMGAGVLDNAIVLLGGSRTYNGSGEDCFWTDTVSGLVTSPAPRLKWRMTEPLPEPNVGYMTAQKDDLIFVIGGRNLAVWAARLLPEAGLSEWTVQSPLPLEGTDLTLSGAVYDSGYIYVVGGLMTTKAGARQERNEVWVGKVAGRIAAGQTSRYQLRINTQSNVVQSGARFELQRKHVQRGSEPMVIEAEDSTSIEFTEKGMTPLAETNASGGRYIAFVKELVNLLTIETAGDYQVWQRAYFPRPGSWGHGERMDEGPVTYVQDSAGLPAGAWVWVKGPRYKLCAGEHIYGFPSPTAYCGGARLDKLVLTADLQFVPTGTGLESIPSRASAKGEWISNRFRLDDMGAWRLAYEMALNGGSVEVEYSHDRGNTWRPYVADGAMRPVRDEKWLTFRFRLNAAPDGDSPRVENPFLEFVPAEGA
ncbi:MAG: hypothetical protein PHR35_12215, partial [Kiritimatiellae bacterium]|nr:hypothetical protein [Kiritimatiellia bacterium]